ncbi:hypothetical protein AYI70_g2669 [Smittium culicis]|uniref:Uncharacterized protein n=1 Tax=Smittium culicis TaxID=133412 RepID=A0A1R1Y7G1_9FUNG|nr:hypothetical protein AYI70_g2669 [Smittium culicis]
MGKGATSLPKSWYWEVQPAKFVATHFCTVRKFLTCPNPGCKVTGGFIKDSNGTGKNQKACFRCGAWSEENLPAETGLDSILTPPSPRKPVDPAQPIYVDVNSKVIPGDDIGLAVIDPSVNDDSFLSDKQVDTTVDHSELEEPGDLVISDSDLLLDMEIEAAMGNIPVTSKYFDNFKAVVLNRTDLADRVGTPKIDASTPELAKKSVEAMLDTICGYNKPCGSKGKQRAPVDFPSHNSASYLKTATVGDFTPIKHTGIVINDQSSLNPAPLAKSLTDFSLGSTFGTNKRAASPPARASKRQNLNTSIYVTNDAFSHRMDLHLNDIKELIKKNRAIDLSRIEKLEEENKFLREQLAIQTKRIDRLTQQSRTPAQQQKPKNSLSSAIPTAAISSAQPITFNFGTPAQPVGLPLNEPGNKKLSYSEIAKSQTKNSKDAQKLAQSIRKLVGTKPINSGTRAEKTHKLARIYVQGISRQRIKDVKGCLYDMHFQLSKIYNMDFIGKRLLEFTVTEEYAPAFCARVKAFEFLKLMPKVNPIESSNPLATDETKEACKTAYINRLKRSIETTTKPEGSSCHRVHLNITGWYHRVIGWYHRVIGCFDRVLACEWLK